MVEVRCDTCGKLLAKMQDNTFKGVVVKCGKCKALQHFQNAKERQSLVSDALIYAKGVNLMMKGNKIENKGSFKSEAPKANKGQHNPTVRKGGDLRSGKTGGGMANRTGAEKAK